MRQLESQSFVWTGGQTQEDLKIALRKSAVHGYHAIEFAYLRPHPFGLDQLARQEMDVAIGVTMGVPRDCDLPSTDPDCVAQGRWMLSETVAAGRDIREDKPGGNLYSAHMRDNRQSTQAGWKNSVDALLDIGCARDIVFESFSTAIADEALSLACVIWRDTWTDTDPLAVHACRFTQMKHTGAARRRATNVRA